MAKSNPNGKPADGPAPSKSEAIREALAANPKATTKEIVAGLADRGIKVQPSLVYMVKSKQGRQRRRVKRERVRAASQRTETGNPVELVRKVKDLADEAGGIRNLKLLVDLLAE